MLNNTKAQIQAATQILLAVADAIREAGTIPSGVLYATMSTQVSKESFDKVIRLLKSTKMVHEENNLLIWKEK